MVLPMRIRTAVVFGALTLLAATRARATRTFPDPKDDSRNELVHLPGHNLLSHIVSPLPHTYLAPEDLPKNFRWDRVGTNRSSYLTKPLNQHVPQWCGSCWAHAAMSSLAGTVCYGLIGRPLIVRRGIQAPTIDHRRIDRVQIPPAVKISRSFTFLTHSRFCLSGNYCLLSQIASKSIARPRVTTLIFRFNIFSIVAVPLLDRVMVGHIRERIISFFKWDLFRTTHVNHIWRVPTVPPLGFVPRSTLPAPRKTFAKRATSN